jgi:predicted DNA-binding protein
MTRGGARPGTGPKVDPLGYMVPFTLRIPAELRDRLQSLSVAMGTPSRELHRELAIILIESMKRASRR